METADTARRTAATLICAQVVAVAIAACDDGSAPASAECVSVVDGSGESTDQCLPIAAESERVDLVTPTFKEPTLITNKLFPTSLVAQTIYGGSVDGEPFRTEVTRLPGPRRSRGTARRSNGARPIRRLPGRADSRGRDRLVAQADDGSVWYFGEDVFNFEDGRSPTPRGGGRRRHTGRDDHAGPTGGR